MGYRLRHGLAAVALAAGLGCAGAGAMTLDLPMTATLTGEDVRAEDQVLMPTGPRSGRGGPGLIAEGRVTRRAWIVPGVGLTPFQLLDPLADQLEAMGFEERFQCRDRECGGFDLRLALDLLDAPAMHVDLGNFRYYLAEKPGDAGPEVVSIVTSRSAEGGHIHLTLIAPASAAPAFETQSTGVVPQGQGTPASDIAALLEGQGNAVLDGLEFRPGSSQLGDGPFPSVTALADWLSQDEARTVVLVGHSDNVGSLEDNIRLSERRAASVQELLVEGFGIAPGRLSARGVGYLAPIASNDTPEGRRLNRRVEAVVGAP